MKKNGVSIHARRATGDATNAVQVQIAAAFQFTPVVRRATYVWANSEAQARFQFTPVVRRATLTPALSIGAPRFQFTPVVRRATSKRERGCVMDNVSIHARRATGDNILRISRP